MVSKSSILLVGTSYTLTTKPQSNDKGDWYSWDIKRGDIVSANQYEEGKRFHNAVKKGSVEVNYEQTNESSGTDKPDTDNPFKVLGDFGPPLY